MTVFPFKCLNWWIYWLSINFPFPNLKGTNAFFWQIAPVFPLFSAVELNPEAFIPLVWFVWVGVGSKQPDWGPLDRDGLGSFGSFLARTPSKPITESVPPVAANKMSSRGRKRSYEEQLLWELTFAWQRKSWMDPAEHLSQNSCNIKLFNRCCLTTTWRSSMMYRRKREGYCFFTNLTITLGAFPCTWLLFTFYGSFGSLNVAFANANQTSWKLNNISFPCLLRTEEMDR